MQIIKRFVSSVTQLITVKLWTPTANCLKSTLIISLLASISLLSSRKQRLTLPKTVTNLRISNFILIGHTRSLSKKRGQIYFLAPFLSVIINKRGQVDFFV
jgi:hypothetical protein